ncbi:MAG: hypothetical protein R3181_15410, partial [Rubricoccaceae bacterium]|nr:hypothetical protein [Rubricoccaceae bacterium]
MPQRLALAAPLLLALALAPSVRAQPTDAVAAVRAHFLDHHARYGASERTDVAGLVVSASHTSRASGATYVYLHQGWGGVPVVNTSAQAAVSADGRIVGAHARFVAGLAERAGPAVASLSGEAGAEAAAAHLTRTAADWYRPGVVADSPGETSLPAGYLLPDLETARLVYVVTEAGPVR